MSAPLSTTGFVGAVLGRRITSKVGSGPLFSLLCWTRVWFMTRLFFVWRSVGDRLASLAFWRHSIQQGSRLLDSASADPTFVDARFRAPGRSGLSRRLTLCQFLSECSGGWMGHAFLRRWSKGALPWPR